MFFLLHPVLTHLSLSICCEVVHFCHVHQFDKVTGQRRSDMSWSHKQSGQFWHSKKRLTCNTRWQTRAPVCSVAVFTCTPVSGHRHGAPSRALSLAVAFVKLQRGRVFCFSDRYENQTIAACEGKRACACVSPGSPAQLAGTSGWSGTPVLLL